MLTPILETDRMILRPLVTEYAEDIFERWTSDDRVSKYMRWSTHSNVDETKEWLALEEENNKSNMAYQWGFFLKDSDYLFGGGGLYYREDEGAFELGYNIMHQYWNQGYTTEAINAIMAFVINELGQGEFIAEHAIENPASGAVLRKCGFVYERDGKTKKFDGKTEFEVKCYRRKAKNVKMLSSTLNTRSILPDSLRYIRSDVPTKISEEDKQWLLNNNILTIVDLRTEDEQKSKPCPLMEMEEFAYITVSLTGGRDIPATPELVPVSYLNMVDEKMDRVIDIMESATTNVLYFCNMGKDRTGTVSAILLRRMGKCDEYIIADYTKTAANLKNVLEEYVKNNPCVDINVITPKAEHMRRFLQAYDKGVNNR